jgi:hypothetical protein
MRRCSPWPTGAAFPATMAMATALPLLAGCGSGGPAPAAASASATQSAMPAATGRPCGTGKTAAGVPVLIEISRGTVACAAAMRLERAYAAAVAAGQAPGNGGGGPVTVRGWVCSGFDTPEILRSGDASQCTRAGAQILAVLPSPSASPASSS